MTEREFVEQFVLRNLPSGSGNWHLEDLIYQAKETYAKIDLEVPHKTSVGCYVHPPVHPPQVTYLGGGRWLPSYD